MFIQPFMFKSLNNIKSTLLSSILQKRPEFHCLMPFLSSRCWYILALWKYCCQLWNRNPDTWTSNCLAHC